MLLLVLALYTVACVYVMRLSTRSLVRAGTFAGAAAVVANVVGAILGGSVRAVVALPVLVLGSLAASRAFNVADDLQRDTDEERNASRTGMALVALAISEGLIVLVFAFVWLIARAG